MGRAPWRSSSAVDGAADHVHHPAANLGSDRHRDGRVGAADFHAATEAVGRVHGDGADRVFADMLLDLDGKRGAILPGYVQGLMDGREPGLLVFRQVEMHIDHGADDLGYVSGECCHEGLFSFFHFFIQSTKIVIF